VDTRWGAYDAVSQFARGWPIMSNRAGGPFCGAEMPSRRTQILILLGWLAILGYVGHRDVWPRLFSDAPPAIRIELSDEATASIPARWTLYRGPTRIGSLTTVMTYQAAADRFEFTSTYRELTLDSGPLRVQIPELTTRLLVSRVGAIRGQSVEGKLIGKYTVGPVVAFTADAQLNIDSFVNDGVLNGTCEVRSTLGDIRQPLEPVPVPEGQALNPLLPVNRLRDVRPGRRWLVYEIDPLGEALSAIGQGFLKQHAGTQLASLGTKRDTSALIAEVSTDPEPLPRKAAAAVSCWVISYRREGIVARTWVSADDGKVMRQAAYGGGETLRLERED
jgi:hypothetical protein